MTLTLGKAARPSQAFTTDPKVSGLDFGHDADTGECLSLDPRAGHLLVVGAAGRGATQTLLRIARSAINDAIAVHVIGARAEREYAAIAHRVASIADTPFRISRLLDELSFDLPGPVSEPLASELPPAHTLLIFDNEHVLLDLAGTEALLNFQRLVRRGREIGVIIAAASHHLPTLTREGMTVSDFAHTLHLGPPTPIAKQLLFGEKTLPYSSQKPGYGHFNCRTGIHYARIHPGEAR